MLRTPSLSARWNAPSRAERASFQKLSSKSKNVTMEKAGNEKAKLCVPYGVFKHYSRSTSQMVMRFSKNTINASRKVLLEAHDIHVADPEICGKTGFVT